MLGLDDRSALLVQVPGKKPGAGPPAARWINPRVRSTRHGQLTTFNFRGCTLPETNIAPENRPLEKEVPIENHHFHGLC